MVADKKRVCLMDGQSYPWHDKLWHCLQQWRQMHCLHHATLLWGQSGIGKQHFATLLAQSILCPHRDQAPCGGCTACHLVTQNRHPDLLFFNAGQSLAVEGIRSMQTKLTLSPQLQHHTVVVLLGLDRCHAAVINALLKQVEEPLPGVYFIFTALNSAMILPTLVSRCQRFDLTPRDDKVVGKFLEKHLAQHEQMVLFKALFSRQPLNGVAFKELDLLTLTRSLMHCLMQQGDSLFQLQQHSVEMPMQCWLLVYHQLLVWMIYQKRGLPLPVTIAPLLGQGLLKIRSLYSGWALHSHFQRLLDLMRMIHQPVLIRLPTVIEYLMVPWGLEDVN
jgi:hypothetical protein